MQPETHESYLAVDSNPLFSHGSASSQAESALALRHDQRGGSVTDIVGPAGGAACVEIEVYAILAEPRDLGARPRVGHAMDHTQ